GTDAGRGTHHAAFRGDEVHRAALAARAAGGLAVQLGDHLPQVAAAGPAEGVATVGAEDDVARAQRLADADRDRLLADRQVDRAPNAVPGKDACDLFLGGADPVRDLIQPRGHARGPP